MTPSSFDCNSVSHCAPYNASITPRYNSRSTVASCQKPSVSSFGLVVRLHCCQSFHPIKAGLVMTSACIHSSRVLPSEPAMDFVTSYGYLRLALSSAPAVCAGFINAIFEGMGNDFPEQPPTEIDQVLSTQIRLQPSEGLMSEDLLECPRFHCYPAKPDNSSPVESYSNRKQVVRQCVTGTASSPCTSAKST